MFDIFLITFFHTFNHSTIFIFIFGVGVITGAGCFIFEFTSIFVLSWNYYLTIFFKGTEVTPQFSAKKKTRSPALPRHLDAFLVLYMRKASILSMWDLIIQ